MDRRQLVFRVLRLQQLLHFLSDVVPFVTELRFQVRFGLTQFQDVPRVDALFVAHTRDAFFVPLHKLVFRYAKLCRRNNVVDALFFEVSNSNIFGRFRDAFAVDICNKNVLSFGCRYFDCRRFEVRREAVFCLIDVRFRAVVSQYRSVI